MGPWESERVLNTSTEYLALVPYLQAYNDAGSIEQPIVV